MGRSETFEHTANLGMRVFAADLPDLLRTAGQGLFDVIVVNRGDVRVVATESITVSAESPEDLLFKWLNELIFLSETKHFLYTQFEVALDATSCTLDATIGGEPIDRNRHVLDHEVKAATRHGLSLRPEQGGWVAEVILDI